MLHGAAAGELRPRASSVKSKVPSPDLLAWMKELQINKDDILPLCTKLGLNQLTDVCLVQERDLVDLPVVHRRKFVAAAKIISGTSTAAKAPGKYKPLPFPSIGQAKAGDAHAEAIAAAYMRLELGFVDAKVNGGISAPDGGVDVVSSRAVAQVKANFRSGPVKRAPIAQLIGDTIVQPYVDRERLFFAASYSDDAVQYARKARVRLFLFDDSGCITRVP